MKILFFYFIIALFILRGIVFSSGVLLGGDWSLPFTLSQMRICFENGFYTWSNEFFFGFGQFLLHGLPFYTLIGVLAKLGISGEIYLKLFLVAAFAFPALTMYLLGRFLNCGRKSALLGGVLYFTLPFFFNYIAIGWLLVLFSMGILPLAIITFIKSVKEKSVSYSILTGLLYFLALVQSQSLIWYLLVFLSFAPFLINDKKSFFVYLWSLSFMFFVFLCMNAYWGLPLFVGAGGKVLTTKLGLSTISLGTWGRLSNLNILRGWGSLYNYQYETAYLELLEPVSFILPVLAYSSLIVLRKRRIIFPFVILSFVPVILFNLGPNFIVRLPFSDFIRDMGRFSVISSFSYVVLAMMVMNFMFEHKQKGLRILGLFFCFLLIISAHPFWKGELSGGQKVTQDIRLRTYQFPEEYIFLENFLAEEKGNVKILYLPLGGALNTLDDERFYGAYKEMRDIFVYFSPKPGEIGISDKGMGNAAELILKLKEIQENRQFNDLPKLLNIMGVKYAAVRKNVDSYSRNISGEEIASFLNKNTNLVLLNDWNTISVFENNTYLPHFYIPQNTIYSDGNIADLLDIMSIGNYQQRSGVFLKNIDESTKSKIKRLQEGLDQVFVRGELANKISKEEIDGSPGISLPYVHWRPVDFIYPLILRAEEFDKWKSRKEPKKLIEKHLFYASKRIAELEKFGTKNINGLVDYILTNYKKEMMGAIKETEKNGNKEIKVMEELRTHLEAHMKNIDQFDMGEDFKERMRAVFDDLGGKVAELEPERNFSGLVYKLDVPKEGGYEIYIKDINELTDYSLLGEKYLEEGKQELILPFSGMSENLIDENLKIWNYQSDAIYRISFDYKAPKSGSFFVAEGKNGEVARTDLLSTGDIFRHFERFFNSSSGVADASIHLSISVAEEKNLKVERIYQPEMMLRISNQQSTINNQPIPRITFVKINPTKYRIKVEGVIKPYTLVFGESFHQGWKVYINRDQRSEIKDQSLYGETVASYFEGEIKEGTHKNIFLDRNTFETWRKEPLSEERHLLLNGYANSWYITPENSDGKKNYEIVVEFWPQRLFYIGIFISGVTLIGCLSYLTLRWIRNRK